MYTCTNNHESLKCLRPRNSSAETYLSSYLADRPKEQGSLATIDGVGQRVKDLFAQKCWISDYSLFDS